MTSADKAIIESFFGWPASRDSKDEWAAELIRATIEAEPDHAWKMILKLIEAADDDAALAYVAAGPLEDLLMLHGADFVRVAEQEAKRSPRVMKALSYVWLTPPDKVNQRLLNLLSKAHALSKEDS